MSVAVIGLENRVSAGATADTTTAGARHPARRRPRRRLNEDFRDLLIALHGAGVRFIVVGAHAMAVYSVLIH